MFETYRAYGSIMEKFLHMVFFFHTSSHLSDLQVFRFSYSEKKKSSFKHDHIIPTFDTSTFNCIKTSELLIGA